MVFILVMTVNSVYAKNERFEFQLNGKRFQYTVLKTGENFTFKFDEMPGNNEAKLKAGYHVLQSVYQDSSINKTHTESYIKERARCYVFDSYFHTYTLCLLPNDFSKKDKNRFWGYVTQLPNWAWLLTRFFLPVAMAFGLVFYLTKKKKN